jgi:hypothetical protein
VDGLLDEVALYPHVLSAAQVTSHYGLASQVAVPVSVTLPLAAVDPDGDDVSFTATGLPPGLTVHAQTGVISGTLAKGGGVYHVVATAAAGIHTDTTEFTWTVSHVNHLPQLGDPGQPAAMATEQVSLALIASDWDGDALSFAATGLPDSVVLDPATGVISGAFPAAGSYAIVAAVSDGTATASRAFTWHVTRYNRAPVLVNPGGQTTAAVFAYRHAVMRDLPVAYWRLHDSGSGSAADATGQHDATMLGGLATGQAGPLADGSTAVAFDGSNGYMRVPNAAPLQLPGDLTIEMWINVAPGLRQTLISKDYLNEFELTLETNGRLNMYQGNGTHYQGVLSSVGAIVPNTWQHVVVTRSAASRTVAFYVDGVAKGTGTYTITPAAGGSAISIGRARSGIQHVSGQLSDVAIYAGVLDGERVAAHYAMRTASGVETPISLPIAAADADGDPYTFSATGLPAGLTIDAATGVISGLISGAPSGTHSVTVTVSDGLASTSESFFWTVTK